MPQPERYIVLVEGPWTPTGPSKRTTYGVFRTRRAAEDLARIAGHANTLATVLPLHTGNRCTSSDPLNPKEDPR